MVKRDAGKLEKDLGKLKHALPKQANSRAHRREDLRVRAHKKRGARRLP
jgi:hypothetical protein